MNKVKPKANKYCLEKVINRQTIVDQMAAWLQATSMVNDNQEITNIQFGELYGKSDTELVPMKIYIKEVKTKK